MTDQEKCLPKGWLREEFKRAQERSAKVPAWARPVYMPKRGVNADRAD